MTDSIKSNTGKGISFLSPLSILILLGIASRIFLLSWFRGEYTDGIVQIQLFENRNTFFPPLYPLLIGWVQIVVQDPILAGRLVSLLASTLVLIPLYHLARRLFDDRVAWWAGWFYLAAAVPNRWSLRVMSDSLFAFFFMVGLLAFICSMEKPSATTIANLPKKMTKEFTLALSRSRLRRWLYLLIAAAGLATLTRYQGLALLPLILVSMVRNRKGYTKWEGLETTIALIPWGFSIAWIGLRGFGHTAQFTGRVHTAFSQTLLAYWDMAETFILFLPYVLTLPVFGLLIAGFCFKANSVMIQTARWTVIYLLLLWLPVHAAFQSFQYRYFLPLIPLMLLFAGRGVVGLLDFFQSRRWKGAIGIAVLMLIQSFLFSGAVIYFQRNAFADFTEVGQLIAEGNLKGGRIFASEFNGSYPTNLKLAFWSGKEISPFPSFGKGVFNPGDYVILSNSYNPLEQSHALLSEFYRFEVVHQTQRYSLIPLLPDIMVSPRGATSQPICMAYRFHEQLYYSYVIRITGPKS